jgi:hypothetical protein
MKLRPLSNLLLGLALALFPIFSREALAKSHPQNPDLAVHRVPFEAKMELGLFGVLGASMTYTLHGKRVRHYREFKELIYPLMDEEASNLIRQAQEADTLSWVFVAMGLPTGLDIALSFKPVSIFGVDWMDRTLSGFAASQAFIGLGLLFESNAEGLKFNAVQRYNHLVAGGEKTGLAVTPQVFASGSHWDFGLRSDF